MPIQIKIVFEVYWYIGYVTYCFDFENDTSFAREHILVRNAHLLIKDALKATTHSEQGRRGLSVPLGLRAALSTSGRWIC